MCQNCPGTSPASDPIRIYRLALLSATFAGPLGAVLPLPSAAHALTIDEKKAAVLATSPELLQTLGAHLIVGYDKASQLAPLLARGAIGGVFVTARNAKGRSKQELASEIFSLRALSAGNGLYPLWIAADQEGGSVARLSPPLPRQRSLGRLLHEDMSHHERAGKVYDYAAKQAGALAEIGVNLNFAPVVDLRRPRRLRGDRHTNLHRRAISGDAGHVAGTAKSYCQASAARGVLCTLKHFPGLRTVDADTHIIKARILASRPELETRDWAPFWVANGKTPAAIMMSHAHFNDLDASSPASTSKPIITDLLRREWGFDGLIITDDLYMAAIRRRPGGMAQAAIDALNAGADLILITPDGNNTYEVLHALIEAHHAGKLDSAKLVASGRRLSRYARRFAPASTARPFVTPIPTASPRRTANAR